MASNGDTLRQMSGDAGIDAGGDPGDQAFLMNRKFARISGSPVALVDREFQRASRQAPRTLFQNTPTPKPGSLSISGILLSAGRGRRGRKRV